jgi:hypothetical protein
MNKSQLQVIEDELHNRINSIPHNNKLRPIPDGIMDFERYLASDKKVLLVLKEAHDTGEERGGWLYKELFDDENIDRVINGSRSTFHPIIYSLFGIRNNGIQWAEIPDVRDDSQLKHLLKGIAIINLKKIPGETRSTWQDIKKNYSNVWKDIVLDQMKMYKPDIILFGGTFSFIAEDLNITRPQMIESGSLSYIRKDDVLYIDAYHPGQTKVKQEQYVNDIVNIA